MTTSSTGLSHHDAAGMHSLRNSRRFGPIGQQQQQELQHKRRRTQEERLPAEQNDSSNDTYSDGHQSTTPSLRNLYRAGRLAFSFVFHLNKKEQNNAFHGLQVIGAGFARTGTKSTELALTELGYKVYDIGSMIKHNHVGGWVEAARKYQEGDTGPLEEMTRLIEAHGYTCTLDHPMNLFAVGLAEIRPSARVVMTVRDSPEKWFESFRAINRIASPIHCRPWSWVLGDMGFPITITSILLGVEVPSVVKKIRPLPWYERVVHNPSIDTDEGRRRWIEAYTVFRERVESTLDASRLLVFNVKQGWGPLLGHLQIDDPRLGSSDFPNFNDRESLAVVRRIVDVIAIGLPLWPLLLFLSLRWLFGLWTFFLRKFFPKVDSKTQ